MEGSGGYPPPSDSRKCYKCGEGGHFIRDCAEFWKAKALGRPFVPSLQPSAAGRTGRAAMGGALDSSMRRSRSANSGSERSATTDDTNTLMREYLVQMAEERRIRVEREAEEERRRTEEEARRIRENKRLRRLEERQKPEEERDARLLHIIRSEMCKDREEERERYEKKGKMAARSTGMTETVEEEKERLRRLIAPRTLGVADNFEDEELLTLRMLACKLGQAEKHKRGPDLPIGNSPPVVTPEEKPAGVMSDEARARIELLKTERVSEPTATSTPTKIDLSLKHILATCGPGGKEKFEKECFDFYDALTIEELKEACRQEKVAYGNRDLAIKRLIIRRAVVAYDPTVIPLPSSTPRVQTRSNKGVVLKEEAAHEQYDSEDSLSDDESE
ncbi:hypothetical protein CBR_g30166 [Chara braunii]|uniref:CCHC-type domain-containing protein n=1 Tax=Chara braunii TaxID=69332 RepID=A0A388LC66_CHABU|nr:hypothetical protein CBR_g30166 [Chara braunii]|eukprot:GBG79901.1 hypothetical protein CBR_g30166 [Chara braunii]